MKSQLYSFLKFLIGWPLTVVAFFFIIKLIAPEAPHLLAKTTTINPALFIYGVISFVLFYFLRSYIWHRLITGLSYDLSFRDTCYMWAVSELKRYIPGNIWSFLGRTLLFSEKGVKKKDIGHSLIIEAELFVLGSFVVSILALPFLFPGFDFKITSITGFTTLLAASVIFGGFVFFRKIILNKFEYRISKYEINSNDTNTKSQNVLNFKTLNFDIVSNFVLRISNFLFPPYLPKQNFILVLLSTTALFFFGLGNYLIISSLFPLHPQMILQLTGFFVLAFVAGYLSILTPAGFGVREGIIIFGLSRMMTLTNAGFAALFSRIMLILAELIFIAISFAWHKIGKFEYRISKSETNSNGKNIKSQNVLNLSNLNFNIVSNFVLRISNLERWVSTHIHETIVLFLSLIYTLYFTTVSFLRYDHFYTGRFDLGNMAQTVWNTTQGRIFLFTNPDGTEIISRLAFHADFILVLLAPFYALWSSPKVLLLIQTVGVAAGAFFVFFIAKHIIKNKNVSLAFAFAYLMNPSVQRSNLYDFHAVVLATTFLLATYYFYLKRKYILLVVFAILAALCKEQIWVIIALFGGLLIIRQKKFLLGAGLAAVSIGMFYYLVWHAIPNTLGSHHFALSFYADLGDGPSGVIKTIIFSPDKILAIVFEESRVEYLKKLFSPLGYLSFLSPLFLIFAGPDFAINLLSSNANFQQIYYQYTATITPFLFIAAIFGYRFSVIGFQKLVSLFSVYRPGKQKNENWLSLFNFALMSYLIFSILNAAYSFGPLPGSRQPVLDPLIKPLADREYIDDFLSQIPQQYRVTASNNVASHLSEREHIYVVPQGIDKADMAVFLLTDPWSIKRDTELVEQLKMDPQYKLVVEKGKFVVFKRN